MSANSEYKCNILMSKSNLSVTKTGTNRILKIEALVIVKGLIKPFPVHPQNFCMNFVLFKILLVFRCFAIWSKAIKFVSTTN